MQKVQIIFVLLTVLGLSGNALKLTDILHSARGIAADTTSKISDFVPSSSFLLQKTKDAIIGHPYKVAFKAINHLCSAALSSNAIEPRITPDIKNMSFVLMTPTEQYTFPLLEANQMWTSPAFDPKKKVVILTTGWKTDLTDDPVDVNTLSKAYFCRGDTNFVVVDSARFIDTLYTWSALNTEGVGEGIGKGLVELIKIVPRENIHLIGHSLGAHISGAAGRSFAFYAKALLPRITGLDPANPCFNEGETLSGLQRGDAEFIDVIHTNPGVLGKRDPVGDVDFYPGGVQALPPGCVDIGCAHGRSWQYYAESVKPGNERNFMAVKCTSLYKLLAGECSGEEVPMGYATPRTVKGNYFLDVNSKSPFGKNASMHREQC